MFDKIILTVAVLVVLINADCDLNVFDQTVCCKRTLDDSITQHLKDLMNSCATGRTSFTGTASTECQDYICRFDCLAKSLGTVSRARFYFI